MTYQAQASFERVSQALIDRARTYQVAILCDVGGRRGALNARIKALHPTMRIAGPAFTVEVRPGDNLMFHVALAVAKPGDIIVVDGKADATCALFGDLMVTQAHAAKLGGFVVDAASRDTASLAEGEFPIFAAGTNPCGPTKGLPGRLAASVSVGGVAVNPGDLIVGDIDGVVVIPSAELDDVIRLAQARDEREADVRGRIDFRSDDSRNT